MAKADSNYIKHFDVLAARLPQARGALRAILTIYTEQKSEELDHVLSAGMLLDALSAADALLDDAARAMQAIIQADAAKEAA